MPDIVTSTMGSRTNVYANKIRGKEMITTGSKFREVENATTSEIAKRIRIDIEAAIKSGRIPDFTYAVRTRRQGFINVRIENAPFQVYTYEYFENKRLRRFSLEEATFTEKGRSTLREINEIADQYTQMKQVQVGFYDSNVYVDVQVEPALQERDRRAYERKLWASGVLV